MRDRSRVRHRNIERTLQCAIEPLEARRLLTVTLYVDPTATGTGDGGSWTNAYTDLQPALQAALSIGHGSSNAGISIDVAQGTYSPGNANANATFQLIDGVSILGGFAGNQGADPNARNVSTFKSTLSGAVFHVVTGSGTDLSAVLDGLTISGGNAGGAGGGDNSDSGGGMLNVAGNPTVSDCAFINNAANTLGGAIADFNSAPSITNCTFTGDTAHNGGAIASTNSPAAVVVNCTFSGDSASLGGAAIYTYNSSPHITDCVMTGNHAQLGGALYNRGAADPVLTNCLLASSTAIGGGAIADSGGSPDLINCDVTANSASQGGVFFDFGGANPVLVNCIVWANSATSGGEIQDDGTGNPSVTYSDFQGGFAGTANINADPRWTNPAAGNYQLMDGSPCVDAGNNAALPAGDNIDLASEPRIIDGTVDMGAFESPFQNVTWTGAGDGVNWGDKNNWSNKSIPNASTRVTIPSGVHPLTVGAGAFAVDAINSASAILINGGDLTMHGNAVITGDLTIQNGGALNLTNAGFTLNYSPTIAPFNRLRGYLSSGAIFSSTVQANPKDAIGYADGSVDNGTAAQPGQVVMKYTLNGDTNLDGFVNFADLVAVVQNFNKAGTDWAHGNFQNGPSTNFGDLVTVVQNFNKKLNPPAAGAALRLGGSTIPLVQSTAAQVTVPPVVAAAANQNSSPAAPAPSSASPDSIGNILQSDASPDTVLSE